MLVRIKMNARGVFVCLRYIRGPVNAEQNPSLTQLWKEERRME